MPELRDFLDRVLELKALSMPDIDRDGNLYTARNLTLINPPLPDAVEVHTLSGLVDLMGALAISNAFINVESPTKITVNLSTVDSAKQRAEVIECTKIADTDPFRYGNFYNPDDFVIALQSKFADGAGDIANLLVLASNVKQEAVTINEDDGFSQKLSASAGVHLKQSATAKSRVMLAPYRTFPEVDQPISLFLFVLAGAVRPNFQSWLCSRLMEESGASRQRRILPGL